MGISLTPVALRPPLEGSQLVLGVGEHQDISYRVSGEAIDGGHVVLVAEPFNFELVSGEEVTQLGSGVFNMVVEWRLKAVAPGDNLRIEITATADGDVQTASLPVAIHSFPKVD